MNPLWIVFCQGFVGAFRLAANIVLAIAREASTFVHADSAAAKRRDEPAGS